MMHKSIIKKKHNFIDFRKIMNIFLTLFKISFFTKNATLIFFHLKE